MTRPPALPCSAPSSAPRCAAGRAGRTRLRGDGRAPSRGSSRCSAPASRDLSRPDSALRDYERTAICRAIYRHAREYLPEIAKAQPDCKRGWHALVALRRGARAVILETSVVRAFSEAVNEKRQLLAKQADDLWNSLMLGEVNGVFDVQSGDDISAAQRVATALAEMLSGFQGVDAVRMQFEGMASMFRESELSLRQLRETMGDDLTSFQSMKGTIEQCATEAIRILSLFESQVGDLRVQLHRTLKSPAPPPEKQAAQRSRLSTEATTEVPRDDDCIGMLLLTLQRDLCDRPMTAMLDIAEEVNRKVMEVTANSARSLGIELDAVAEEGGARPGPAKVLQDAIGMLQTHAAEKIAPAAGSTPAKKACLSSAEARMHCTPSPCRSTIGIRSADKMLAAEQCPVTVESSPPCGVLRSSPVCGSASRLQGAAEVASSARSNGYPSHSTVPRGTPQVGLSASKNLDSEIPWETLQETTELAPGLDQSASWSRQDMDMDMDMSADINSLMHTFASESQQDASALDLDASTSHPDPRTSSRQSSRLVLQEESTSDVHPPRVAQLPRARNRFPLRTRDRNRQMKVEATEEQEDVDELIAAEERFRQKPEHYMSYMGPKAAFERATKARKRSQVPTTPAAPLESPSRAISSRTLAPLSRPASRLPAQRTDGMDWVPPGPPPSHASLRCRDPDRQLGHGIGGVRFQPAERMGNMSMNRSSSESSMTHSRSDSWLDVRAMEGTGAQRRRACETRSAARLAAPSLPSIAASPVKIAGLGIAASKVPSSSPQIQPRSLFDTSYASGQARWGSWETPAAAMEQGQRRRRTRTVQSDMSLSSYGTGAFLRSYGQTDLWGSL